MMVNERIGRGAPVPAVTRRDFMNTAARGAMLTLSFTLPGGTVLLTPAQARERNLPLRHLTATQARQLTCLAEGLVPGAGAAGLTHFIDHQLGVDPNSALLIAKYFQVSAPYKGFYDAGLEAVRAMSSADGGQPCEQRDAVGLRALLQAMSQPDATFGGFPVFLFYLCLRSDAIDVVYGSPEGFARLNIPYMQHILPPQGWNG